jgi:hypothetical protein
LGQISIPVRMLISPSEESWANLPHPPLMVVYWGLSSHVFKGGGENWHIVEL